MGVSRAKLVRDKLAMRVRAREAGILVPDFTPVLNYDAIRAFADRVPPPWVLKPRAEASTVGIEKIESAEALWPRLDALGDRQSFYVLERYVPGEVYHVDALSREGEVIFAEAHGYARPPLDVYHSGGIAVTRTLPRESEDAQALDALNRLVISALELRHGASHMEFIRGYDDGRFYFLEVGARVGGANIAELVEASTGINLWREWARLELSDQPHTYELPARRRDYAGVIVTLARQEHPDTSAYADPEIVWRMEKHHHVGFVLAASEHARIEDLLHSYSQRFAEDFLATLPAATDLTLLRGTPRTDTEG
jgi:biotin carboxylase